MLSEEKVKQQLQGLIKQIGLKDQVKKHLRVKLAQRLLKTNQLPQFKIGTDLLRHRIISSVIKEHLDKIGCSYSSSVFAAESECDQKMLERVQLIQLLNLKAVDDQYSLFQYFIEKSPGRGTINRNMEVQTNEPQGVLSLEQKFTIMDLEFRRVLDQHKNNNNFIKSHDCEQEKRWYQNQLHKFKQFQAHKIKIRVGEEWRLKFQTYASDMQDDYRKRLDRLRKKEKSLTQQFITRQKIFEEKIKDWQKTAKSRMELLQMKQITVNKQKTSLQVQRKKINEEGRKAEELSKQKLRQSEKLLLNVQKRIDYEVGVVKLSLEQAQNQKQQQFANRRKFVDQQYGKLMGIKDSMELLKIQNERLSKENTILREQSKKLRQELRLAYGQISSKGDRIDVLRDELTETKNLSKDLQIKLAQQQKLRKKRQNELSETRKELESYRLKFSDQSQDSQLDLDSHKFVNEMELKIAVVREQRRKDIQKFKLQI